MPVLRMLRPRMRRRTPMSPDAHALVLLTPYALDALAASSQRAAGLAAGAAATGVPFRAVVPTMPRWRIPKVGRALALLRAAVLVIRAQPTLLVVSTPSADLIDVVRLARPALRRLRALVLDSRDPLAHELAHTTPGSPAHRRAAAAEAWALATADLVWATTPDHAALFDSARATAPAMVVPNGPPLGWRDALDATPAAAAHQPQLAPVSASAPLTLAYTGILGGKLLPDTLGALAEPGCARWSLHVIAAAGSDVGTQTLIAALRAQAAALGITDRVRWTFNVTPDQVIALLREVDLGLNPLPAWRGYCLPIKTFDYVLAGVPQLALSPESGVLARFVSATGAGLHLASVSALGATLAELARDPQRLAALVPRTPVAVLGAYDRAASSAAALRALLAHVDRDSQQYDHDRQRHDGDHGSHARSRST